jgi:hypothetical protein
MTSTPIPSGPILLLHKSHKKFQRLTELMEVLDDEIGAEVTLGMAVNLPNQRPERARQFFSGLDAAALRIADPAIHYRREQLGRAPKQAAKFPYLTAPWPVQPDPAWISDLFEQQINVSANVVLSPTGLVDDSDPGRQLATALEWVQAARQLGPPAPMFVNLTLAHRWLSNRGLLDRLLEELVESTEPLWYLRIRWGVVKPPHSQQRDDELLRGYKELATVARSEGKTPMFPTSGLTGWLAAACGAAGLGTGMGPSEQGFAEQPVIRLPAGVPRIPKKRYFERSLLHVVDVSTHMALLGSPGYVVCDCRFCKELDAANPRLDPANWDNEAAALHYLVQTGRLLASLRAADPQIEARREVERARAFESTVSGMVVTGDNRPRHLAAWDRALQ